MHRMLIAVTIYIWDQSIYIYVIKSTQIFYIFQHIHDQSQIII